MIYKIVQVHNNQLYSASRVSLSNFACEYAQGKKTFPRVINTYLFAFSHIEWAQMFMQSLQCGESLQHYQLWACDMPDKIISYDSGSLMGPQQASFFWPNFDLETCQFASPSRSFYVPLFPAPRGTILVDSITLRMKVQ